MDYYFHLSKSCQFQDEELSLTRVKDTTRTTHISCFELGGSLKIALYIESPQQSEKLSKSEYLTFSTDAFQGASSINSDPFPVCRFFVIRQRLLHHCRGSTHLSVGCGWTLA